MTRAFLIALLILSVCSSSEARRRKKFKGIVIVNQILKLEGKILRNGEDAPEYSGVKQGDFLETQADSFAIIRIPGLAIFRMGPNTKFKLTHFNDRNDSRVDLESGSILALYRRVGDHEFGIAHGTISLHGTTFYVVSSKDGKTDQLCLCNGKVTVDVKNLRKPQSEVAPQSSAAAVSADPSAAPATPVSTPVSSGPTQEVQLISANEHKQCDISDDTIEVKSQEKLLDLHPDTEIKELESLYALP